MVNLDNIDNFDVTKLTKNSIDELPSQAADRAREAQKEVQQLRDDPSEFLSQRRRVLDRGVDKTQAREPTHEGNISMNQHLKNLRNEVDETPEKVLDRRVERLNRRAERAIERQEELEERD